MKRETPVNSPSACVPSKKHPWRKHAACIGQTANLSHAVMKRNEKERKEKQ